MNEKTIFIILIVVTVGLATVTGVLAWDNMQLKENTSHKVDLSNNSTNNTDSNTNTKVDPEKFDCPLCGMVDESEEAHDLKHTYTCNYCGKKIFGDGAMTHTDGTPVCNYGNYYDDYYDDGYDDDDYDY